MLLAAAITQMEDELSRSPSESTNLEPATAESIQIARIGVESVLSKMPIHNLAKKGRVDIQITRRRGDGQVDLKWEVSYNERYGQPRQLAYKLDTIIVNRRIDEEGRPIPRFIRLGSLNELCEQLGSQKNELKRAIRQNATTSINAKLKYKGIDGTERELEALFSRYSVYFTGEKLPDGRTADAVYIELNGPYREVLNNAPIRPLNYEYLKALQPAPQRFYEIISGRIYAALKNKNPLARILYSEFCTYSALTRHLDYENFRVQMAKIHRPHLKSGYITKAHFEPTTDEEGRLDWMMCYQPGPRARAEYMTFAKKSKQLEAKIEAEESLGDGTGESEPVVVLQPPLPKSAPTDPLLEEFIRRGITVNRSKKLLAQKQEGQDILGQLEWGDHLIASEPRKFRSPAGFYIWLLTENVLPPPTFETTRQRREREQAEASAEQEQINNALYQEEYEGYQSAEVDKYIREHVDQAELQEMTERKRQHLVSLYKHFRNAPAEALQTMLWAAVKTEIRPRVRFISFEEFVQRRKNQPTLFEAGSLGPTPAMEEKALETETPQPSRSPKMPSGGPIAPRVESNTTPKENDPYKAFPSVSGAAVPLPVTGQGSEVLGASDNILRERYEKFYRKEINRALNELGILERGRRLKTVRTQMLTEHPERDRFHQLITDGEYEQFHKLSEQHLMEVVANDLRLPSFEDWKRYALSAMSSEGG